MGGLLGDDDDDDNSNGDFHVLNAQVTHHLPIHSLHHFLFL
jgi:hypothetical protein